MAVPAHSNGANTSDRVAAITLFAFAVVYGIAASRITYSFSSDPLGPKVFPLMLAGMLAFLSVIYFVSPGGAEPWPKGRLLVGVLAVPTLVLVSGLLFEPIGFGISMVVLVTGVGRVFGASWKQAIVGGIAQAVLWFVIFSYLLAVYLPAGTVFGS